MQSVTQYNRKEKKWEVWQGDYEEALHRGGVVAYPAGKEGKRAATLAALAHDAPQVAAEVEAFVQNAHRRGYAQAIDRAIRAGLLVAKGKVKHPRPLAAFGSFVGEVARVESSKEDGLHYAVTYKYPDPEQGDIRNTAGYYCECPDARAGLKQRCLPLDNPDRPQFGAPYIPGFGYACKHSIAHFIADRASVDLGDEAIPFEGEPVPVDDEILALLDV